MRRHRYLGRAPAAILLAACASLALVAPSLGARGAGGTQLRLLRPHAQATVQLYGPTLVVRLRASGPGFRARLDGHGVTGRFHRTRGRVRVARFKRGRDFGLGPGTFSATVGKPGTSASRSASFQFTAWRRDPRPLRIRRVRSPRAVLDLHVRSGGRVSRERVWVNGRPAHGATYALRTRRGFGIELDADRGLRFGRNRVAVEVRHPDHAVQRSRVTFRLARSGPLPGAGPDVAASPTRAAVLDASQTRPARHGARLRYAWRIVAKPRGAKAHLAGAHGLRPRLRARTPGRYRVRLRVTTVPRRGRAGSPRARAAADSTPAQPLLPPGAQLPAQPLSPAAAPLAPSPLRSLQPAPTDDVTVTVKPTDDPMGLPIQTITEDGGIQVGETHYPPLGKWMSILVLDPESLQETSYTAYRPTRELGFANKLLKGLDPTDIVIMTVANPLPPSAAGGPGQGEGVDLNLVHAVIKRIGGLVSVAPTAPLMRPGGLQQMWRGTFSIIGHKGLSKGRAWQSQWPVREAAIPGFLGGSRGRPGSINGYMQQATGRLNTFVSPEFVPIDTAAAGSDLYTHNTIEVGGQRYDSGTIANGATGAQLLVLGTDHLEPVAQATYTIIAGDGTAVGGGAGDPAHGNYGSGVQGLATTMEYFDRTAPGEYLVILQTFGQGQWWGNTPNGSPNWVDDNVDAPDLYSWEGGDYADPTWISGSVPDGSDNPNHTMYGVWNPGFPTVAGQVGSLTSGAGHDIVANFGYRQNNRGTPNGGLTLVANTSPYDGRLNFVQGQTGREESLPRVVGTLTRTRQGQWSLRTPSATGAFAESSLWETAFGDSKPWPYTSPGEAPDGSRVSNAEAGEYRAAMAYLAARMWGPDPRDCFSTLPTGPIADVRLAYGVKSITWDAVERCMVRIPFVSGQGFGEARLKTLVDQLLTEMGYVESVRNLLGSWAKVFNSSGFDGYVGIQEIAEKIAADSEAKRREPKEKAHIDPAEVIEKVLLVGSGIVGFSVVPEVAEPMALFAHGFTLATMFMGEPPENGSEGEPAGDESQEIATTAADLGVDLANRYSRAAKSLSHLADLMVTDWGRLQVAGRNADGKWSYTTVAQNEMEKSLRLSVTREAWEAMLPLTYEQWVVDPNATGATDSRWGGDGLALPGRDYRCWNHADRGYPSPPRTYPFKHSPDGALHVGGVHGWAAPGSTTAPAAGNQSWATIRVLKSKDDPLKIGQRQDRPGGTVLNEGGADPPASMVDPLFKPIDPNDDGIVPTDLGIDKDVFFGDFNRGWGWRRMVCS